MKLETKSEFEEKISVFCRCPAKTNFFWKFPSFKSSVCTFDVQKLLAKRNL
jgi:hypothetical protein